MMIPVKAKTDGAFGKRLAERIAKWAGKRKDAARIRTTEDIDWWHYQEFGTPEYRLKPDPTGQYHDEWAAIWRRDAKALAFEHHGEHFVTTRVPHHPGIPARHMIGDSLPLIREKTAEIFQSVASQIPDNPDVLKQVAVESTTQAKSIIRDSFERNLSNHSRDDGRLQGKSAAQAFEDSTEIVTNE